MPYEHILVEKEEGVAILTLNRPEVLNAMNFRAFYELHEAVMEATDDDEIGCIVLLEVTSTNSGRNLKAMSRNSSGFMAPEILSGPTTFRHQPNRLSG